LIPLGAIAGRVWRDSNANGQIDPTDEPIDDAVVVLDAGARSERARKGRYRFDAVRSGEHTLELLTDSLPEGSTIVSAPQVTVALVRDHLSAEVEYLIKTDKRPEVRKVFPPRGGGPPVPAPATVAGAARTARPPAPRPAATATPPSTPTVAAVQPLPPETRTAPRSTQAEPSGLFTIQVAALNDPLRAREMASQLAAAGFAAYVVEPNASDPDGPVRVRVGRYATRSAAEKALAVLEERRGEKLWITKAR
jgi:cell division septation protein DedD